MPRARRRGACSGPTRSWRSAAAWSPTPPASPPPCTTGASPSCTSRPRCSRWSTPPSAARRASTCPRARTWSARSGSRSACSATPTCSRRCPPRECRAGLGEMAKYHSSPGRAVRDLLLTDPAPCSRVIRHGSSRGRRVRGDQGRRWSRPTSANGRAAGHAQLRPHARRTRSRPPAATTCATARRSPSGWCSPASSRARSSASTPARVDRQRRAGRRPTTCPTSVPADARRADELLTLMGRDKKALGGLTFVLRRRRRARDGRRAAGDGAGRGLPGRRRGRLNAPMADDPAAVRAEPEPARRARAGGLRHRHPRRHVGDARAVAEAAGHTLEHLQSNHEGELVDAIHAARGRCAAIVINAGAFTHYAWALADALATFDGVEGRAAPLEPEGPRGVAAHVGGRAGRRPASIAGFGRAGYRLAAARVSSTKLRKP